MSFSRITSWNTPQMRDPSLNANGKTNKLYKFDRGRYGGGTRDQDALRNFVNGGYKDLRKDKDLIAQQNNALSSSLDQASIQGADYQRRTGQGAGSSGGAAQRNLLMMLGNQQGQQAGENLYENERNFKLSGLGMSEQAERGRLAMESGEEEGERGRRFQMQATNAGLRADSQRSFAALAGSLIGQNAASNRAEQNNPNSSWNRPSHNWAAHGGWTGT